MSKTFSIYVLTDVAIAFVLAFFAFTLILFVGNSVKLIAQQVPLIKFLRVIPYLFIFISTYTMPMALLTSVVFTFGRMGLDNELTAIRAAGVSLRVVVLPALTLAAALCMLSLPLNTNIAPRCAYVMESMLEADLWDSGIQWTDRHEPTINLPSCKVFIGNGNEKLYRDVFICEMANGKPRQFIVADTATLTLNKRASALDFVLHDCIFYYTAKDISDDVDRGTYEQSTFSASLPSSKNSSPGIKEMSISTLRSVIDEKRLKSWLLPKALTELHKRISLSFSCLALALVGVPLGMLTKRGNFTAAFGVSIAIIFVLYYPLLIMGEVFGNMGTINPAAAMWAANVVAATIGLALFWRTRRA